jgi:putative addiction module component (TIGR02574 family)
MKPQSQHLLKQALELRPIERAGLVDRLVDSLDKPDDATDQAWRNQIGTRLPAYRSGIAVTVSAADVVAGWGAKWDTL